MNRRADMPRSLFIPVLATCLWVQAAMAMAQDQAAQTPAAESQFVAVFDQAKVHDADFAAAQAALRAGNEAYPQARAAALPTLQATGSYAKIDRKVKSTPFSNSPGAGNSNGGGGPPRAPFSDQFGTSQYGIELRQPLFDWSIPAQLRQAKDQVTKARIQFEIARRTLISNVANTYLNFLKAASQLNLVQAESRALAEDLKVAKARYDVGETGVTGLREAQATYDLVSAREIDAQTALDNIREQLRDMTQHWYERLPGIRGKIALEPPQPSSPEAWVKIALDYNGPYLQAKKDVKIAKDQISKRRGKFLPDVDLVASYTDLDESDFVYGNASTDKAIGVQATWELFSGGRTLSQVREARARYSESTANLESTRRQVAREIRNTYRSITQAIKRVHAQANVIVSASASLKATSAGFEVGERNQADVLNARRDLFQARINHTDALYDYLIASLRLKYVAGIIDRDDLQQTGLLLDGPMLPQPADAKRSQSSPATPGTSKPVASAFRFSIPKPSAAKHKE